ncbi:hypothetical protein ONZ51_g11159 [Trametes cubensis]|uniref:Uncharacterized protein n=1 Tax=Trametes cubensis TaxID=1111947 RepID=A0AAD7X616_9APHY|nr:hypothetical protein ONZ51_g11159 [Trametes cubensis]
MAPVLRLCNESIRAVTTLPSPYASALGMHQCNTDDELEERPWKKLRPATFVRGTGETARVPPRTERPALGASPTPFRSSDNGLHPSQSPDSLVPVSAVGRNGKRRRDRSLEARAAWRQPPPNGSGPASTAPPDESCDVLPSSTTGVATEPSVTTMESAPQLLPPAWLCPGIPDSLPPPLSLAWTARTPHHLLCPTPTRPWKWDATPRWWWAGEAVDLDVPDHCDLPRLSAAL